MASRIGDDHADQRVVADQADAFDAAGVAAHRPGVGFAEADGHAAVGDEHDFVAGLGDDDVDQLVVFLELDGDDAPLHAAGCICVSSVFFTSPRRVAIIR